ncbi:unnamed protein product [Mytilus coruscus]|uniref:CCHC-type domain-containing protein n=1 Tax=Mytilus coruscus TaxID=42192 RepID=A0A6J8A8M3_MYTCO|nr:unnamed protein product [Mytilus coruscus]
MNTFRSNNMEGPCNYQPCRNGHQFPMRKADTCLDFLCEYYGKTLNVFTYHRCYAVNAYCYKCRHHGHFARMCNFHVKSCENPKPKKKSKSNIQRDSDRMRTFIEKKQMSQFPFQGLEDKELSTITCSIQDESAKQHLNKLKASHRISLNEIAVLKYENSKMDTVMKENVMLRNSLDELNLERLQHVRLIQTTERELAEQTCRTENFEIEIVRLKEENLSLTNTRYRLTMDLKSKEMQDYHVIKKLKDEIQRLNIQNFNDIREHQDLLHELSIAENQIESLRTNYSHNPHQRQQRGGYRRR